MINREEVIFSYISVIVFSSSHTYITLILYFSWASEILITSPELETNVSIQSNEQKCKSCQLCFMNEDANSKVKTGKNSHVTNGHMTLEATALAKGKTIILVSQLYESYDIHKNVYFMTISVRVSLIM